MCNENISTDSREAIEDALAWIGPAAKSAIPLLLKAATDSNSKVRANALWALGAIRAEPELCVPELIRALNDSNSWAQLSAARALGMFGTNAQSAIPSLTAIAHAGFTSGNFNANAMQVQFEARNALKKISPRALPPQSEPVEFASPGADWSLPTQ